MNKLIAVYFVLSALSSFSQNTEWTWVNDDTTRIVFGNYGTKGVAAPGNRPGGRSGCVGWTDTSGNLWLFGGYAFASGSSGVINDLWKYDTKTNWWTWVSGDDSVNTLSVFGIKGVADTTSKPGGRDRPVAWTDNSNNLWLFGGFGNAFPGSSPYMHDLWKYNIASNLWTWVGGNDSMQNHFPTYGTRGTAAPANWPGGRVNSAGWADDAGNLWLFGGNGFTYNGQDILDDLWKYNIASNQWTWVNGDTTGSVTGVYGTRGVADSINKPGSRQAHLSWKDKEGNLWMYGGSATTSFAIGRLFGDLWKYDPVSNRWTWMSGDLVPNTSAVYGTKGTADPGNKPGSRSMSMGWTDNAGDLWMFGGDYGGYFMFWNDLWKYNIANDRWTWVSGDNSANITGIYGAKGIPSANNKPGSRMYSATWKNNSGNFWLLGGEAFDAVGNEGYMNDLWSFKDSTAASLPLAQFSGSKDTVCTGNTVSFTDQSSNSPTQWKWTFSGGTPDTSSRQNPTITYNTAGTFDVILVVNNSAGSNTLTKTGYITVITSASAGMISAEPDTFCSGDSSLLRTTGSVGSIQWQSSVSGNNFADISGATHTSYNTSPLSQTTSYRLIASNGVCADTSDPVILMVYPLPAPPDITGDSMICSSDSALLQANTGYSAYYWNTGEQTSYTYATTAGAYWVTVSDPNGCQAVSEHHQVSVFPVSSVSLVVQGDTLSSLGADSYQWYFNNAALAGDTGPVYIARQTGDYAVGIIDSNGCKVISNNTHVLITGIYNLHGEAIMEVYPNPFANTFFITADDMLSVEVYDITGRVVFIKNVAGLARPVGIDLAGWSEGMYYLKVKTVNANYLHPVIKQQ